MIKSENEKIVHQQPFVGQPLDRVDGRLKVTGMARYPAEFPMDQLAHAVIVQSTVALGHIKEIDTRAAEAAPGVLAVLTYLNAPSTIPLESASAAPLQNNRILYHGQHVAVIIAETLEQATFAATLVSIDYEEETPLLHFDEERATRTDPDAVRGEPDAALAVAAVSVKGTYTTPTQHHNAMAPFATIARWEEDNLTLHDTTQGIAGVRKVVAKIFGLSIEQVRVIAPFIGGAFGSGLRCWPHVVLSAMAARYVGRPVKLVLTREQMYTSIGYRPRTIQHVALGATRDGHLTTIIHEAIEPTAASDNYSEDPTESTHTLYASPNLRTSNRQDRLDVGSPTWMRGPGEAQGVFALETAIDELAYALEMDPIALRMINDPPVHPDTGQPWSSRALRECYQIGAERFGWERRTPAPRSMRDGKTLIGWGVASGLYPYFRAPAEARIRIFADGSALIQTAATDIGTGTYTIMTQIAADALGIPPGQIRCELGDSLLPASPSQGGSVLAASVGSAVQAAAQASVQQVLTLIQHDETSPLYGASSENVIVSDGRIICKDNPSQYETYTDILKRHGLDEIETSGRAAPGDEREQFGTGVFGAKFAEVRVDIDLGRIQVTRMLSVIAAGRILNEKTARSQIIGGTVGGVGMALFEQTFMDETTGHIVNANLADYVLPVHADIPPIEVLFFDQPDTNLNPLGIKGIGEVAIVGVAPAIGNAIYHATGRRVRDLPITLDKLL
ncbi:acylaldehyde oxidase [Ktedonobacteria bacterium brp13]|nr:acylaldehyde oxidase [Ktedonobacteria bacterium brp13]